MTIAVAHQLGKASDKVLAAAAEEANRRGQRLVVIHAVTELDLDSQEALRSGIDEILQRVLTSRGFTSTDYEVRIVATPSSGIDDTASTLLDEVDKVRASMLVIGARRRSPLGKALLGSVTQDLLLDADVPVLVVKA